MLVQMALAHQSLKHLALPILQRSCLNLLTSVFDFMTHTAMLIWKQMMLLHIRTEFIAEGYEV